MMNYRVVCILLLSISTLNLLGTPQLYIIADLHWLSAEEKGRALTYCLEHTPDEHGIMQPTCRTVFNHINLYSLDARLDTYAEEMATIELTLRKNNTPDERTDTITLDTKNTQRFAFKDGDIELLLTLRALMHPPQSR